MKEVTDKNYTVFTELLKLQLILHDRACARIDTDQSDCAESLLTDAAMVERVNSLYRFYVMGE